MFVSEYFMKIIDDNHCVEWIDNDTFLIDFMPEGSVIDKDTFEKVLLIVKQQGKEVDFWEYVLPYLSEQSIYDSCFDYFIKNKAAISMK